MIAADSLAHFDAMFARDPDPWDTRTRWYEVRKRALLIAALPHLHYERAYEPGCANGELTVDLAGRCDELIASDASEPALAVARARVREHANVTVARLITPTEWPDGRFDLIVLSEFGYYLPGMELERLAERCRHSVAPGGVVVGCHWRHRFDDFCHSGDEVHATLGRQLPWERIVHHLEADFALDVWCEDPRSVAQRTGAQSGSFE